MIKRTVYFGNPCSLRKKDRQVIIIREDEKDVTIPIEDLGIMILDDPRIKLSNALIMAMMENNVAIIVCNDRHLPEGLMLPMTGHHAFAEKVKAQTGVSEPLRKNLWQQTVVAKIKNQAAVLKRNGLKFEALLYYASVVKSGDTGNLEGRAAQYYWQQLFSNLEQFKRERFGDTPNNLLNYGYAVLRAVLARSLVGSGLMTFMGIHHKNKYNPYVLADDIMEPYRPYVDMIVLQIMEEEEDTEELTPEIKRKLLVIPALDVVMEDQNSPLMIASQRTTASLMKCFEGIERKLLYPVIK